MRRPRLVRVFAVLAVAFLLASVGADAAFGQERTVRLPTERDALPYTPYAQMLLFGDRGIETQLPGRVADRERVDVGLDTNGSISRVVVFQRLMVSGLGDFQFRVPGPARDVTALPGSATNPGLRKGSVLWQGFSSGREVLAAEVDLMPALERDRLPLEFELDMSVAGRPLEPGRRASGPFELKFRVLNSSEFPFGVETADADPGTLAPVLDRVRTMLARRERPVPGRGGVPKAVPVEGRIRNEARDVRVPFVVRGQFEFRPGSLTNVEVTGAARESTQDGTVVTFRRLLGGGAPNDFRLSISGVAQDLALPELVMWADPTLPSPRALEPPVGETWQEGVRVRADAFDGARMVSLLVETMWEAARIRQFEAYLGNPDYLRGDSNSTYLFRLSPRVAPPPAAPPPAPPRPGPIGVTMFALAALAGLAGLGVLWSRS
ncbi:MAG: hypothetical protein M3N24_01260 [Actinomycetota bacterium]|nr:hypothetical protein [Actinomycetota bacterium]